MFRRIKQNNVKPSQRLLLNGDGGDSITPEATQFANGTPIPELPEGDFYSEPSLDRERNSIIQRIRQAVAIEDAFGTATESILSALSLDRVLIYRFDGTSEGQIVSEALVEGWTPAITEILPCVLFGARNADEYHAKGLVSIGEGTSLSAHQKQLLARFQVRSSLTIPILLSADNYSASDSDMLDRVWGLLVLQQCSPGRRWNLEAINLLERVSTELTLALQLDQMRLNVSGKQDILSSLTRQSQNLMQDWLQNLRLQLEADRILVYAYNPDWSGGVLAEAIGPEWERVGASFPKHFGLTKEDYKESYVVDNIYAQDLSESEISKLEILNAKAYILVPIVQNGRLLGVLGAYQNSSPRNWQEVEAKLMLDSASKFAQPLKQTEYIRHTQFHLQQAKERSKQEQLIATVSERLRQTEDLPEVLRSCVQDIRKMLGVDRVGLFQFSPESNYASGEFVVEDVSDLKYSAMAAKIQDHCFVNKVGDYSKGKTWIVNDVRELGDIEECLVQVLDNLQVKASMLHPLMKGDELWGLFAIHKCDGPRQWHESEIEFARRISLQLNLALQQADYIDRLKESSEQLTQTLEREKVAKEVIQQQAIDLLMAVQPATAGDLTARAKVTEDEVGTIAAVYNTTLDSLVDLVVDVAQATQSVVTVADASSSSIEELAGQAQNQLQQVDQAQTNIQAMVEATDLTTQNALKVGSALERATASVESGDTAMNDTVASIMTIRETVTEAVKRVDRLSEASQKIAKVVNLIGGFANQTNLLALNAALEATRAGEYGKGFAVVADEVRNLAHQSSEATTEVEKLVQEVQFETKHVAAAMEAGIQQVMEGSDLVTESRTSLNDIVAATAEITQLVTGITQAAERQMQTADSATAEMTEVSSIASGTYEASKDIVSTIAQLSKVVQELQARIGQFKVS
ncbi:MAG: GAF domain-containing protein [Cyanobacteria bacterium J06641_5]